MAQIINVGDTRPPVPGARITDMNPTGTPADRVVTASIPIGAPADRAIAAPVPAASLSDLLAPHLNLQTPQEENPLMYGRGQPASGPPQVGAPEVIPRVPPQMVRDRGGAVHPASLLDMFNGPAPGTRTGSRGQLQTGMSAPVTLTPQPAAPDPETYAAGVYARPEAATYMAAHPAFMKAAQADPVGFASKLGPVLDAAIAASGGSGTITHVSGPGGRPMVKTMNNPGMTAAVAQQTGLKPEQVAPFHNPEQYTDEEYLHAMQGTTWRDLKTMWAMQHYLDPQQAAAVASINNALAEGRKSNDMSRVQAMMEHYGLAPLAPYLGMVPSATQDQ